MLVRLPNHETVNINLRSPYVTNINIFRYPADACYVRHHANGTKMSRSCVWMNHCTPHYLCDGDNMCDIYCCYHKHLCNIMDRSDLTFTQPSGAGWFQLSFLYGSLLFVLFAISRIPDRCNYDF